ncbi:transposase [Balneolaceae bacterium ANBcel3]|nr:transposase [Balneolaceae bacterium ANBcel3]
MVKPATLIRHYKKHSSDFKEWDQRHHAKQWLVFPENLGPNLSIDEVSLSNGELYTLLTNKSAKGRKGSLVASIRGTRTADLVWVMEKLPPRERAKVLEVSMDMAKNVEKAVRKVFFNAKIVTDRFHVVQLAQRCLQQVRIEQWRNELENENEQMAQARECGQKYRPEELANGDTPKQLLARSRFALMKFKSQIKDNNHWLRLRIAFQRYPELEKAYNHTLELRQIFNLTDRNTAEHALNKWIQKSKKTAYKAFYSAAMSLHWHRESILNFFDNRTTNASAESFNARIKLFRANQKGVRDTTFFLFRLSKLYA